MLAPKRLLTALALSVFASSVYAADEVVVYSSRIDELIKPVFDAYTAKTGVKVKFITDKEAPLMQRIKAEGQNATADLLLTVDAGNLWQAEQMGILQPIKSEIIDKNIPPQYRSSSHEWTGLSLRARTIAYASDRVKPEELSTYEALADKKWEGRLCLRTAKKVYNQSLTATMIEVHGAEKTETYLKAVRANAARKPGGGDRDVARDIQSGLCDIAIINTYYIGLMSEAKNEQKGWYDAIKPLKSSFAGGGTHVNVSAAAIAKNAPNKENAVKLVEYMLGEKAQHLYADGNFEYPVNADVKEAASVKLLGALAPDTTPLGDVAKNRKAASELVFKGLAQPSGYTEPLLHAWRLKVKAAGG